MGSLEGRVAVVTGGAQGIGRAYCLGFAAEGASVVVADLSDTSMVEKDVAQLGSQVAGVRVDVADPGSTEKMARAAADRFGRIDVLVNNAGFFKKATVGRFTDITVEEWDLAFAVNVRGSWLCAKAVYPVHEGPGLRQDHQHLFDDMLEGRARLSPLRLLQVRDHRLYASARTRGRRRRNPGEHSRP